MGCVGRKRQACLVIMPIRRQVAWWQERASHSHSSRSRAVWEVVVVASFVVGGEKCCKMPTKCQPASQHMPSAALMSCHYSSPLRCFPFSIRLRPCAQGVGARQQQVVYAWGRCFCLIEATVRSPVSCPRSVLHRVSTGTTR